MSAATLVKQHMSLAATRVPALTGAGEEGEGHLPPALPPTARMGVPRGRASTLTPQVRGRCTVPCGACCGGCGWLSTIRECSKARSGTIYTLWRLQ